MNENPTADIQIANPDDYEYRVDLKIISGVAYYNVTDVLGSMQARVNSMEEAIAIMKRHKEMAAKTPRYFK